MATMATTTVHRIFCVAVSLSSVLRNTAESCGVAREREVCFMPSHFTYAIAPVDRTTSASATCADPPAAAGHQAAAVLGAGSRTGGGAGAAGQPPART